MRDKPGDDWRDHPATLPGEVRGFCKLCGDLALAKRQRKWVREGRELLRRRERGYGPGMGDPFAGMREEGEMESKAVTVIDGSSVGLPATMDNAPATVLAEAQKAASALKDVIARKPKPVLINGEQYLEFEDWQTVGRFYGVTVGSEGEPEFVELAGVKGFKATAIAIRNGQTISRATAYCMSDEERWATAPTYQVCSMAQTRANAKALRNVLSWVAVLAGYKPTPAEEMDGVEGHGAARSAATVPACAKCKTAKKVIASKYAKNGVRPWYCLQCKATWGNAEAPVSEQPPEDSPWEPGADEAGARG